MKRSGASTSLEPPRPRRRSTRPTPLRARRATAELPDVRDGLTRTERVVLTTLAECQAELGGRPVPTALLYGRVVERLDLSVDELQAVLARLVGR